MATDISKPGFGWTNNTRGELAPLFPVEDGKFAFAKLNESPNVILLFRLQSLRNMSDTNFMLAVATLAYVGVNVTLLIFNFLDNNDGECGEPDNIYFPRCGSPISEFAFHILEFNSNFFFSIVQAFALLWTPKSLLNISDNPIALKFVLFFSIVSIFDKSNTKCALNINSYRLLLALQLC